MNGSTAFSFVPLFSHSGKPFLFSLMQESYSYSSTSPFVFLFTFFCDAVTTTRHLGAGLTAGYSFYRLIK